MRKKDILELKKRFKKDQLSHKEVFNIRLKLTYFKI